MGNKAYIYGNPEVSEYFLDNFIGKNIIDTKVFIYIGDLYDSEFILNHLNNRKINFIRLIKGDEISNSIVISFGMPKGILMKNNNLVLVNVFGEDIKNVSLSNYIMLFTNKLDEYNFSPNSVYILDNSDINREYIDIIIYKAICNFYYKRNKNLFSVKGNYKKVRLDLPIGKVCDKNCIFCNEGGDNYENKTINTIEYNEKAIIKENPNWVILSDREPTFTKNFIDNLQLCNRYDINTISVITSGGKFKDINFCREALDNGLNEIRLSIHGHNAKIHDDITQKKGSFEEIIKTLDNLSYLSHEYDFDIFVVTVICKQNKDYLNDILDFLKSYSISRISFTFVELIGKGYENKEKVVPTISEASGKIEELLSYYESKKNSKDEVMNYKNIPPCAIFHKYINYSGIRTTHIGENYSQNNKKIEYIADNTREKEYLSICEECDSKKNCEGIHLGYSEIYSTSEFFPLKNLSLSDIPNINLSVDKKVDPNNIIDLRDLRNIDILAKSLIILNKIGFRNFAIRPRFLINKKTVALKEKLNINYYNVYNNNEKGSR